MSNQNQNAQYILDAKVLEALFQYLSRKPYQEVNVLIQMIQGARLVDRSVSDIEKAIQEAIAKEGAEHSPPCEQQQEVGEDDNEEG